MRRTKSLAAALLATVVVSVSAVVPTAVAHAQVDGARQDATQVVCPAAGAVCDAAAQVRGLLTPIQPVLDLLGPVADPLSGATGQLLAALGDGSSFDAGAVADASGAVLGQLGGLADLLRSAGVDPAPIESAVSQLRALANEALTPLAPVLPVPAPAPAPAPEPAPNEPAPSQPASSPSSSGGSRSSATSSGNPSGFIGPVSTTNPSGTSRPPVPGVPRGGSFELAPLGLPEFAFGEAPFEMAALDTDLPVVGSAADPVLEAVNAAVGDSGDSKATAVVLAVSMLLLASGLLLDQLRKARQPIQLTDA